MLKGTIHSISGDIFTVTITEKDSKIKEIDLADEPCIIERSGEDDGLFSPIISTSCTLHLISDSDYQFDYLATDDYPHVVVVAHGFEIVFVGPIEKGLHKEAYDKTPFTVEVIAGCGIKNLKNWTPHFPELTDDFRGAKEVTIKELIEGCLTVAGDHIKSTFDTSMMLYWCEDLDAKFNAREWLYKDGRRSTDSAYDILSDILTTMGASIAQVNGKWRMFRAGDLRQLPNVVPMEIDNDKLYFVDNAEVSLTKACGAMEITMPLKQKDNLILSRPDTIQDDSGWTFTNNGGTCERAKTDGFDILTHSVNRGKLKWDVCEFSYKIDLDPILSDEEKFNQIRMSCDVYSPNTKEADDIHATIAFYPEITDESGKVLFACIPSKGKNQMTFVENPLTELASVLFSLPTTQFDQLQKKGGTTITNTFNFDPFEVKAAGGKYLCIHFSNILNSRQKTGSKYHLDKFITVEDAEFGKFSLTVGREFEDPEERDDLKLYVKCEEADESIAEELEVGFPIDSILCHLGVMIRRLALKNGKPIGKVRRRGWMGGDNPITILARDRMLQFSYKRSIMNVTQNKWTLHPPFQIFRLRTNGKILMPTSQIANLYDNSNEMTLEELITDENVINLIK